MACGAVRGGGGDAEVAEHAIYLVISLRNVGTGIAVLHGWRPYAERRLDRDHGPLDEFHRLGRDIYVSAGDDGFWQGALRDPSTPEFATTRKAIETRHEMTVEILYGDHEGGQRMVSRFLLAPRDGGDGWLASVGRHWNIDRDDPR